MALKTQHNKELPVKAKPVSEVNKIDKSPTR